MNSDKNQVPIKSPEFFVLCPFCKTIEIRMNSFGAEAVGCSCGVYVSAKLDGWDAFHDAAKRWNALILGLEEED